jgi:hypothetical protein
VTRFTQLHHRHQKLSVLHRIPYEFSAMPTLHNAVRCPNCGSFFVLFRPNRSCRIGGTNRHLLFLIASYLRSSLVVRVIFIFESLTYAKTFRAILIALEELPTL